MSPTEAKSIIRELTEAGVQLGNGPADSAAPVAAQAGDLAADDEAEVEAAVAVVVETVPASAPETDLDDQTSVMGDSVHTYLKSIGRRSLLTAEEEVDLAKRIEAGLFAEHKLETEPKLSKKMRADLEAVADDGRRAKAHMLEANLRLVACTSTATPAARRGPGKLARSAVEFDYTRPAFSTWPPCRSRPAQFPAGLGPYDPPLYWRAPSGWPGRGTCTSAARPGADAEELAVELTRTEEPDQQAADQSTPPSARTARPASVT